MTETALAVHYSAKKSGWRTPAKILDRLGPIALDPCTGWDNPTKAVKYCVSPEEYGQLTALAKKLGVLLPDGLSQDWAALAGNGLTFVNPPYGRTVGWWIEHGLNVEYIVYLLASRTDVKWFHKYRNAFDLACFIKGRIVFNGLDNLPILDKKGKPQPAPFPSLLLFRGSVAQQMQFVESFHDIGTFVG